MIRIKERLILNLKYFAILIVIFISFFYTGRALTNEVLLTKQEVNTLVQVVNKQLKLHYYDERKGKAISQKLNSLLANDYFYSSLRLDEIVTRINTVFSSSHGDGFIDLQFNTNKAPNLELSKNKNLYSDYAITYQTIEPQIAYVQLEGVFTNQESISDFKRVIYDLRDHENIILDISEAQGASFSVIHQYLSLLLEPNLHIANIKQVGDQDVIPIVTDRADTKSSSFEPRHIVILQSSFNEQTWEFFADTLQQKGSVIIGEESIGNANISQLISIGNQLILNLPYAVIERPTDGSNWTDEGVIPNYFSSKAQALSIALAHIEGELKKH